jgi:hypothetical protein
MTHKFGAANSARQRFPKSRNLHPVAGLCRQWHGREETHITVTDRRILYDTEALASNVTNQL